MQSLFPKIRNAGFYLFAFSIPFTLTLPQIGIALAVVGWIGEGITQKKWHIRWHPMFAPLLGYLAWNILSASMSPRPFHSLFAVLDNEWLLLIMLMLFWCIESERQLQKILTVFLFASIVPMLYAIWQTFAGLDLIPGRSLAPFDGYFRAVGFHGFYLTFAAFAMIVLLFSITLALETKEKQRWGAWGLAVLSFLALLSTFARSIWLSFVVTIPTLGVTRSKKHGAIALFVVMFLIAASLVFVPSLRDRAVSIFDPSQNVTRLNLWKTTLAISSDHLILGIGQDNFDYFFPFYKVEGFYDAAGHPHNDYLNVLVNSGIPGLLAFLGIWGIVLWDGFKRFHNITIPVMRAFNQAATLSIIAFLVGAFFQNYYGTFLNCMEWWFLTGVVLVTGRFSGEKTIPSISESESSTE